MRNTLKTTRKLVNNIVNTLTILLNYSTADYQHNNNKFIQKTPLLTLLFFCSTSLFNFAQSTYKDSVQQLRIMHTSELLDPEKNMLSDEEKDHFQGLDYFLINESAIIEARFEYNKGKKFKMLTSTDRTPVYRRYGYVYFKWNNEPCTLTVYQNLELSKKDGYKDYLFIPFRDETSGEETYGGGRYLDLKKTDSSFFVLDFNLAYNPYCAYSIRYSCPVPPEENTLHVEIEAGEKTPIGH